MPQITKTSAKADLEFGDTPTSASFSDLIDSFQIFDATLLAIATAAQGGQTGLLVIESTAEVTTRAIGAGVIAFMSAATTSKARQALELGTLATANTVPINSIPNRTAGSVFIFNADGSAATLSGTIVGQLFVSQGSATPQFQTFGSAAVSATVSLTGAVTFATTADVLDGTSNFRVPTVDAMRSHQGCIKGWIDCLTSSATILDSFNIATLAADGVGYADITFTIPFASSAYVVLGVPRSSSDIITHTLCLRATLGSQTAGGCQIQIETTEASLASHAEVKLMFIGDQ